jgi:tetratricopeptide (TPR) repeat protein
VTASTRIEELRRRVQKDPASIAFAQLGEECRRAGQLQEAVDVCRSGLAIHPGYLSARVTLGRALVELNQLDEAQQELQTVLQSAPDNLAARRGVADIAFRRGAHGEALVHYRRALALAKNDPELQERVSDLEHMASATRGAEPANGLSLEQAAAEISRFVPSQAGPAPATAVTPEADRARRMIAALEQWLAAIHVTRAERHA